MGYLNSLIRGDAKKLAKDVSSYRMRKLSRIQFRNAVGQIFRVLLLYFIKRAF
jgi:hypothetical protein